MTISKNIISAVTLSGIILASHAGASLAGDANQISSFKPLQALSIKAGQEHGNGYFLREGNTCKLVVTLTDATNQDDFAGLHSHPLRSPGARWSNHTLHQRSWPHLRVRLPSARRSHDVQASEHRCFGQERVTREASPLRSQRRGRVRPPTSTAGA